MNDQKHAKRKLWKAFGWVLFGSVVGSSVALTVYRRKKVPPSQSHPDEDLYQFGV